MNSAFIYQWLIHEFMQRALHICMYHLSSFPQCFYHQERFLHHEISWTTCILFEHITLKRLGWKDQIYNTVDEEAVLKILIVQHGIKMFLCTSWKCLYVHRTGSCEGLGWEALGKERQPFSTSSLISSLSVFPLVKCHFAIGPHGLIVKGSGEPLGSMEERRVKCGDCEEFKYRKISFST